MLFLLKQLKKLKIQNAVILYENTVLKVKLMKQMKYMYNIIIFLDSNLCMNMC